MQTLIIYAHPETKGHCSTILKYVKYYLKKQNKKYEILDLYKLNYNPILEAEEHYTAGNRKISKQNKEIQNKIKKANHLIFIYPIWWGTMPAILKGFFDRILTPRFAYIYEDALPKGLLTHTKATIFITSGSPEIYKYIQLKRPQWHIQKDILKFCGIKSKLYQIGSARKLTKDKIKQIRTTVKKAIKTQ
jgi:NAD(P)H dehydrogenase (quinone)